jgi:hypothetical protein
MIRIFISLFIFVLVDSGFGQKKHLASITGTVYLTKGVANGMQGGEPSMGSPAPYANGTIYILNSLKWVTLKTDASGVFKLKIEPGRYIVERDSLERKMNKMYFYDEIIVNKKNVPFKVNFKEIEFGQ